MAKKWLKIVAGLLLALALIWWMFKDTDWVQLWNAIKSMHFGWLLASLVAVGISFFTRVQRWTYIVRTAKPVGFYPLFSATQIGFLANFTLPARAGELIRALLLSRSSKLPAPQCLAFVALDRVTDIFALTVAMVVCAIFFHPPDPSTIHPEVLPSWASSLLDPGLIRNGMRGAGLALVGLIAGFVFFYAQQEFAMRCSDALFGRLAPGFAHRARMLIQHFADGLHIFRSKKDMAMSLFFSLLTWFLFAVTYDCLLRAFGLEPPWQTACVLMVMVAMAISVPGAPGFVGQFHAAVFAGLFLSLPTTEPDVARAVAIVGHLVNVVPVTIAGLYCLWHENLHLRSLQQESMHIEEEAGVQ